MDKGISSATPSGGPALSADAAAKIEAIAKILGIPPVDIASSDSGAQLGELIARMDRSHGNDRQAPIREVMARLGDRWSTLILLVLASGRFRHATLKRLVSTISSEQAITQRMLTLRLRSLERDGIIARLVTPTVPPRVDYELTPMGRELLELVRMLLAWIEKNEALILSNRSRFEEP